MGQRDRQRGGVAQPLEFLAGLDVFGANLPSRVWIGQQLGGTLFLCLLGQVKPQLDDLYAVIRQRALEFTCCARQRLDLFLIGILAGGLGQQGLVPGTEYDARSEEHTSELQSLMRSPYAVFCLKKK